MTLVPIDQPTPKPRSGMFGGAFRPGGAGRDIAGYIGDALLSLSGGQPMYAPMKAQAHQQAMEYQRQMALLQYKQEHPDPTGTMQNVEAAGLIPGTPEYQQFMRQAILAPKVIGVPNLQGGTDYVDTNAAPQGPGTSMPSLPTVRDQTGWDSLKSGDHFLDQNGVERIKP